MPTVSLGGADLTPYLSEMSMSGIGNAVDTTNFASDGVQNIAGLPSFSATLGGPWSIELDNIVGPKAVRSDASAHDLRIEMDPIYYEWIGGANLGAFISDYQITTTPNEAISWAATLTCSGAPDRVWVLLTSGLSAQAFNLWTGSTNDAPPAGWETIGFDDSGWANSQASAFPPALPGTESVRFGSGAAGVGAEQLLRQHFTIALVGTSARLQMRIEDQLNDVYINDVRVGGDILDPAIGAAYNELDTAIDPTILIVGDNVLAARFTNGDGSAIGLNYLLTQA